MTEQKPIPMDISDKLPSKPENYLRKMNRLFPDVFDYTEEELAARD
jgi:hypothetical protein